MSKVLSLRLCITVSDRRTRSLGFPSAASEIPRLSCCPVAATTEDAGQAEQVAEVVPGSVVVDLVDTEVVFEQRGDKHERRNKALPEPKPEACGQVMFACRSFGLVS